jgi:aspartate beta-hydroxylase
MAACPLLASLLRERPEVLAAPFSFLGPRKHIRRHRGPIRGIIRFYLVLSMPRSADGAPASVLKVGGVEYRPEDGQFLLWDDTFEHEACNTSDEVRIVLSLDVWRYGMPVDMQILSAALIQRVRLGIRVRGVARGEPERRAGRAPARSRRHQTHTSGCVTQPDRDLTGPRGMRDSAASAPFAPFNLIG